jgi:hypothetical protein
MTNYIEGILMEFCNNNKKCVGSTASDHSPFLWYKQEDRSRQNAARNSLVASGSGNAPGITAFSVIQSHVASEVQNYDK